MRTLIPNLRRPALSLAAGVAGLIAVFGLGQPAAAIDIQVVPINDEVDAWLVEDHTNPLITLKFGFEGGSRWDEPGKEGTASLAFGSLNEGAGEMNAETFLGLLQDEAVSMAGSAGFKWSTVSFQTPTASIDFAFEQLETMLTDPAFDPEGVERMRRDALAGAAQRARAPGAQLGEAFFDALWGEDDPRNRKFSGDMETIPAITQADLFAVTDRIIGRNNVIIAAVGDITPDELRRRCLRASRHPSPSTLTRPRPSFTRSPRPSRAPTRTTTPRAWSATSSVPGV